MIEGMQNVVVTVTGYKDCERMKLIKFISFTGANYVGKMTKSNTHLICWNFEGKKYQFAKEYGILIVNHKWLEDCVKEGKRIPESPYTMQSGQEIGFNIPNLSVVSETAGVLSENKQLLNKPSIRDYLNDVIILDSDEIENWGKDPLLNENPPPRPRSREAAQQSSKKKLIKETLRQDRRANVDTKRATHEPQTPTVDEFQCEISDYSPKGATKQRRSNSDKSIRMGSDFAEPSHRNRRLVKKNANTCATEIATIDVEQQSRTHEDVNEYTVASNVSNNSTDLNIEIEANISRRVETISAAHRERTDDEINYMNDLDPIVEISLHGDDALNAEGRNMKGSSPDVQILNGDKCERDQRTVVPSGDLSCVICWTEFCSTRGVLPCGHRFCFSCIQSWADHKASERKASTCPLCKVDFGSITRVDATASSDQKIYSQTIPCPSSSQDIIYVPEGRSYQSDVEITRAPVCCHCHSQAPAELLRYCQHCQSSCIHEYCLDPPLFPWTCFRCRDYRYFFRY